MSRQTELLNDMAKRLDNLQDIGHDYLVDNNIKSSELDIFKTAAIIIRGYLKLSESERLRVVLYGNDVSKDIVDSMTNSVKMQESLKKLKS